MYSKCYGVHNDHKGVPYTVFRGLVIGHLSLIQVVYTGSIYKIDCSLLDCPCLSGGHCTKYVLRIVALHLSLTSQ